MKKQPEITIFSLDGLNSTGKTTQLRYLKQQLTAKGIPAAIRRGDGSRRGSGLVEADPPSEWWMTHHPQIAGAGVSGPESWRMATFASRRLMDELVDFTQQEFPCRLKEVGKNHGVVLLDRGPVSRLFVARRYVPEITFEAAMGIDEKPAYAEVIPKKVAVLHTDESTLHGRNEDRPDSEQKKRFNKNIVSSYHADFEELITNLPSPLQERTTVIDASPSAEVVGRVVLAELMHVIEE